MKITSLKSWLIIQLILFATFYSCEDSALSPTDILDSIVINPILCYDSTTIEINSKAKGDFSYQIISMYGQIIKSDEFEKTSKEKYKEVIDLKDLPPDQYLIKIAYSDTSTVARIMKLDNTGE